MAKAKTGQKANAATSSGQILRLLTRIDQKLTRLLKTKGSRKSGGGASQ